MTRYVEILWSIDYYEYFILGLTDARDDANNLNANRHQISRADDEG
jgi:hypothetical protein